MNSMFGGMKLNGDEVGGPVEMDGRGSEWGTRGAFADESPRKVIVAGETVHRDSICGGVILKMTRKLGLRGR